VNRNPKNCSRFEVFLVFVYLISFLRAGYRFPFKGSMKGRTFSFLSLHFLFVLVLYLDWVISCRVLAQRS
jgi:hypothetical protein